MPDQPLDLAAVRTLIATAAGPNRQSEDSPDPKGDAAWDLALHVAPQLVDEIERLRANQRDDLDDYIAEQMKNPEFAAAFKMAQAKGSPLYSREGCPDCPCCPGCTSDGDGHCECSCHYATAGRQETQP